MATDLIEELKRASGQMAQYPGRTVFRVEPLPQPGEGCRERFAVWHSYTNGVPISKTEIAVTSPLRPRQNLNPDAAAGVENKNGGSSIKRSHRERRFLRWLGKRMSNLPLEQQSSRQRSAPARGCVNHL
jgi:hypothetical protein